MTNEPRMLQLYLSHRAALLSYAAQITGSRADAEDVVQDAYIRIMGQIAADSAEPRPIRNPAAYLYKVVRNLCLDRGRRARTREDDTPAAAGIAWSTPEHDALIRDEVRRVERALGRLPERTRQAFELHRLHGYTLQETARVLNVSVPRIHQLVRAAMTECARELEGNDVEGQGTSA